MEQGLKPDAIFCTISGTSKLMPCYKTFEFVLSEEFFRSLRSGCALVAQIEPVSPDLQTARNG